MRMKSTHEQGETDVDEQITRASRDDGRGCGWEDYRDDDEEDVGAFDHCAVGGSFC